jgi:hypothetical protein
MFNSGKIIRSAGGIEFTVKYSGRRSMGISISPYSGIVARVPYNTSDRKIEEMILKKHDWIIKILKQHQTLIRLDPEEFVNGAWVIYRGKKHTLKILEADRYYIRRPGENIIEIGVNGRQEPELIKLMLENWYKSVAKRIIPFRFNEILEKYSGYGFFPWKFTVSTMKKRWGSCSYKGKIAVSYDLIRLDDIYTEYVILHELCHLKHHNHGPGFYKLLSEVFPEWQRLRKELGKIIR